MIQTFNFQFLSAQCPDGKNESDCPVQQYLNEQTALVRTINDKVFKPAQAWEKAKKEQIAVIDRAIDICAQCRGSK